MISPWWNRFQAIDVSIAISSYLPSVFRFVYRLASPSSFDICEQTYFFLYLSTTKAMWLNYHRSPTWSSLIEAFKAILSNFQPCIASLGKLLVAFPCSTPTYHKNPDLFGQERKLPQVHIGLHSFTHHRFHFGRFSWQVGRYTRSVDLRSLMWVDNWPEPSKGCQMDGEIAPLSKPGAGICYYKYVKIARPSSVSLHPGGGLFKVKPNKRFIMVGPTKALNCLGCSWLVPSRQYLSIMKYKYIYTLKIKYIIRIHYLYTCKHYVCI